MIAITGVARWTWGTSAAIAGIGVIRLITPRTIRMVVANPKATVTNFTWFHQLSRLYGELHFVASIKRKTNRQLLEC